jgi:hypothetical protein
MSRTRAVATCDGADDTTKTDGFGCVLDVIDDGLATARFGARLILVRVVATAATIVVTG